MNLKQAQIEYLAERLHNLKMRAYLKALEILPDSEQSHKLKKQLTNYAQASEATKNSNRQLAQRLLEDLDNLAQQAEEVSTQIGLQKRNAAITAFEEAFFS